MREDNHATRWRGNLRTISATSYRQAVSRRSCSISSFSARLFSFANRITVFSQAAGV